MSIIRIPLNNPTALKVHEGAGAIVIPAKKDLVKLDLKYSVYKTKIAKPPCQVGDMLYLLETWSSLYNDEKPMYLYKTEMLDESPEEKILRHIFGSKWLSPVTMPNSACRHKYPCTKIEAIQTTEIPSYSLDKIFMGNENYGNDIREEYFNDWFTETYHLPLDSWVWLIEFERKGL